MLQYWPRLERQKGKKRDGCWARLSDLEADQWLVREAFVMCNRLGKCGNRLNGDWGGMDQSRHQWRDRSDMSDKALRGRDEALMEKGEREESWVYGYFSFITQMC